MHVIEATRGHITVQCGEKVVTVYGELLSKLEGQPDYQLYGGSVKQWDQPNEGELLSEQEKEAVLNEVCDYLRGHGRTPVVLE